MIIDAHVHLVPGRLAEKVRAFFSMYLRREDADQVRPFAYPIDHGAVLASMAGDGLGLPADWTRQSGIIPVVPGYPGLPIRALCSGVGG